MPVLPLGDARIAYDLHGSGTDLVLIHAAFVDRRMWVPQIARFSDRHRILAYDIRGHGETGPTLAHPYSIALFAADLEALLDHLNMQRPILCGLSLGGMIAQYFAATHPGRAERLILADTIYSSAPTARQRLVRDVFFPREVLWPLLRRVGMRRAARLIAVLMRLFGHGARHGRSAAVRAYAAETLRSMTADEVAKVFEAFYHFDGVDLSRLAMPTLVLHGAQDSDGIRRQSELLRDGIAGADYAVVPAAGHTASLENPAGFNDILARFLARADSSGGAFQERS